MGGAAYTPLSCQYDSSSAAAQQISPQLRLQAPLSRHGRGPGLVLVLDHYAKTEKSETHLDPEPLRKWAEEGFAVVQVRSYLIICSNTKRIET